jgi:hypothetical protein
MVTDLARKVPGNQVNYPLQAQGLQPSAEGDGQELPPAGEHKTTLDRGERELYRQCICGVFSACIRYKMY